MREFRKLLLLVTDACDTGPALRRALGLARQPGTELTLLDIAEPMSPYGREYLDEGVASRLELAELRRREERRDGLVALAAAAGVKARSVFVSGVPFRSAIEEVLEGAYDLVIKTADTSGPGDTATLGSLDRQMLRQCPCPVWIERPGGPDRLRRILVAVNPHPAAPEDRALAIELLRMAARIAADHNAELHVLHAWKVIGEWTVNPTASYTDPELVPLLGAALNQHGRFLDAAIEEAGLAEAAINRQLVHQRASRAIIDAVKTGDIDLLVMGTLGRTGIRGLLMGNTAERVLGEVRCAVLACKPPAFVSPVTAVDPG